MSHANNPSEQEIQARRLIRSAECNASTLFRATPAVLDQPCTDFLGYICGSTAPLPGVDPRPRNSLMLNAPLNRRENSRVLSIMERVRQNYISWLSDVSATGNLSENERSVLLGLIREIELPRPASIRRNPSLMQMSRQRCEASRDRPSAGIAFNVVPPFIGESLRRSAYAIMICPATARAFNDENLEAVLSHEFAHAIGPTALRWLQGLGAWSMRTQDLPNSVEPTSVNRTYFIGLQRRLLPRGTASFDPGDFVRKLYTSGSEGRPACFPNHIAEADETPEYLEQSPGHCSEGIRTRCYNCFSLSSSHFEEAIADYNGANVLGRRLLQQSPHLEGASLQNYLRRAYGQYCNSEFSAVSQLRGEHPSGPARLARIIGTTPSIRSALGCQDAGPLSRTGHGFVCHPRWQARETTPSAAAPVSGTAAAGAH